MMLISDHLKMHPTSGQLFLFRNRHANKIKMLWWDRNGFWLCYKRLEKGKLKFPPIIDQALELTRDQTRIYQRKNEYSSASRLNFSLITNDNQYYVKISYNDKPVYIPTCNGDICTLSQFESNINDT